MIENRVRAVLTRRERLRNWLLLPLPGSYRYVRMTTAEAEVRWLARNREARTDGCRCGRPGTQVEYGSGFVGSVRPEWWTCDEHVGADSWTGRPGPDGEIVYTPSWPRSAPCSSCDHHCGRTVKIDGPTLSWHCPRGRDESPGR